MLGERIKKYMTESGLKFSAIAEKSGIKINTFSAMLNGNRKITAEEYFAICEALGVTIDFFCAGYIHAS